ncbi:MAG TPA: hypothetical protein VGF23_00820 [Gaiellaceae bacterium]
MRRLAGELSGTAARLEASADDVHSVASMIFRGPAGDRFRTAMDGSRSELHGQAGELRDLAGRLNRAADEVEAAQRARARALEALAYSHAQLVARHELVGTQLTQIPGSGGV